MAEAGLFNSVGLVMVLDLAPVDEGNKSGIKPPMMLVCGKTKNECCLSEDGTRSSAAIAVLPGDMLSLGCCLHPILSSNEDLVSACRSP